MVFFTYALSKINEKKVMKIESRKGVLVLVFFAYALKEINEK